jgi:hypothetical protein
MGTLNNRKARENYAWEVIQDIIDKEVSSAFKLKEPIMPDKREIKQIIKEKCTTKTNGKLSKEGTILQS